MVKKETIHRLVAEKLLPVFEAKLVPHGYKYSKAKSAFIKKSNEYELYISLSGNLASVKYDESRDCIYLFLTTKTLVRIPAYDKWYAQNLRLNHSLYNLVSLIQLYTLLDFNDFSEADFYTPSKAVAFKNYVSGVLETHTGDPGSAGGIPLADFMANIEIDLSKLNERADVNVIFENRDFPFSKQYINLMVWHKQTDKAVELYNQTYDAYLKSVEQEKNIHYLEGV